MPTYCLIIEIREVRHNLLQDIATKSCEMMTKCVTSDEMISTVIWPSQIIQSTMRGFYKTNTLQNVYKSTQTTLPYLLHLQNIKHALQNISNLCCNECRMTKLFASVQTKFCSIATIWHWRSTYRCVANSCSLCSLVWIKNFVQTIKGRHPGKVL